MSFLLELTHASRARRVLDFPATAIGHHDPELETGA
jgi:hypothetical protein